MTWKELANHILTSFSIEQQNSDITVFDSFQEEFYVAKLEFLDECSEDDKVVNNLGVLDDHHPFLMPL